MLSARSSYWAVLMFEAYTERFGTGYEAWADQMRSLPAADLYQIMDQQGMRLGIWLQNNGQWQLIDRIDNIGPLTFREVMAPVDLRTHPEETIRIKVEGGYLLWELDYAAMDFTSEAVTHIQRIPPGLAIASDGRDYTTELAADDQQYLHQAQGGNHVTLWYPAARSRPGRQQSVFLHSKGHYDHVKEYQHPPQLQGLPSLQEPGAFPDFSRQQYRKLVETAGQ